MAATEAKFVCAVVKIGSFILMTRRYYPQHVRKKCDFM